jgi:hypothetical protein
VMRTQFHMAGFRILEWMNYSDKSIEHYELMLSAPPKLSGKLIFGDDAPERQHNSQLNLIERRTETMTVSASRTIRLAKMRSRLTALSNWILHSLEA